MMFMVCRWDMKKIKMKIQGVKKEIVKYVGIDLKTSSFKLIDKN